MGGKSSKANTEVSVDYKSKPNVEEIGKPGTNSDGLVLSKTIIDFNLGEKPCPLKVPVNDQFDISNTKGGKMKFNFEPSFSKDFQLSFSPNAGTVEKGKTKTIKVKIVVNNKVNITQKISLKLEGGGSHFITVRIRCETGVFGTDPTQLETEMDAGFQVPRILVLMKRSLIEYGGLQQEGIFRLAGEQTEIRRIKEIMNKKEWQSSNDVNTVATLIKIWFRELPTPILNALPSESIFYSQDVNDCVAAFDRLPEPQKTLLDWLMNLLIIVSQNSAVNKMTSQNLAIVVAPNLYDVSSSDPMEGLVMSQKCVQFLHNILQWKIARQAQGGMAIAQ